MAVLDALFLVYIEDGGQQRVVFAENQRVVEILEHIPCHLLNLVAGINHVDTFVDRVFHLNGENAGMAVEILGLALESIESVCILQVECCDTSHNRYLFKRFILN